jgi:hypothetical protein
MVRVRVKGKGCTECDALNDSEAKRLNRDIILTSPVRTKRQSSGSVETTANTVARERRIHIIIEDGVAG